MRYFAAVHSGHTRAEQDTPTITGGTCAKIE